MFAACLESSEQILGLRDTEKSCLACLSAQGQDEPCAEILPLDAVDGCLLCMLRRAQPRAGQLPCMVQGKYLQNLA